MHKWRCCLEVVQHLASRGTYDELQGLLAAYSDGTGDLLIAPNGKRPDCIPCLSKHRLLACELLQHLPSCRHARARVWMCTVLCAAAEEVESKDSADHEEEQATTLAAFWRRSPDSPTQMLSTSLATRMSAWGWTASSRSAQGTPRGLSLNMAVRLTQRRPWPAYHAGRSGHTAHARARHSPPWWRPAGAPACGGGGGGGGPRRRGCAVAAPRPAGAPSRGAAPG